MIMDILDKKFIETAEKIVTFNFCSSNFQQLKFKTEIQYLFDKHYFPNMNFSKLKVLEKDSFNNLIDRMKEYNYYSFNNLYEYKVNGIGPGEVMMYYTIDTLMLGGPNSVGDLIDDSGCKELKAVKVSKDNILYDFKLGGTVDISPVKVGLNVLKCELGISCSNSEISYSKIVEIKEKAPKEFNALEQNYKDLAYEYFKRHKTVFINNNSGKNTRGKIHCIKYVLPEDIKIQRVTNGTVTPLINGKDRND